MKYASGTQYLSQGFTLTELLISLAVIAILISSVIPSMGNLIADRRVAAITSEMYSSLLLARSEAVKRRNTISVCSSVNGSSCDQANTGWHHGWLVFSDQNQDGLFDGDEPLLRVVSKQPDLISISWNRGFSVSFNSRGQTSMAGSFEVCEKSNVRAIVISMTGRARVEERTSCS